ncbi:hypothetical protein BGX33_009364 [Mortierella sp. NVP41]|nr:hypothetical protein BGX33_009364 [Mortierella sp. NVP41]
MDKVAPLLMSFLEQQARPQVQTKVTEQLNSTKGDLKANLPSTIIGYLSGKDGNGGGGSPMISQLISSLGPNLLHSVSSVTNATVDTASEGMDTLLTNGIMNIAKSVLTQSSAGNAEGGPAETGGINFDFLKSGKEGMVNTTMAASKPVIKQVSENMSAKLSSAIPGVIGNALQQMMGQQGGGGGATSDALGMAAGLMSDFMNGSNSTGAASILGPKIATLLKPFLAKFETQMAQTLEKELRTKIFSSDYIKSTVMGMLTGGGKASGAGNALLEGVMNAMMGGNGNHTNDGQQSGQAAAMNALGNFASSFMKK